MDKIISAGKEYLEDRAERNDRNDRRDGKC